MRNRALVVEDDASLREVVSLILERTGFDVDVVGDGRSALDRFHDETFDLVLLDLMLPILDGFAVCRDIRRTSQVPIVMLTALSATADLVTGLELGADDYVTKPFESRELLARVRAVMRRTLGASLHRVSEAPLTAGSLVIDPTADLARLEGEPLALSTTEFRLLLALVRRRGETLSRDKLLREVWSYDYLGDSRLVDVAVGRLREKLGDDPRNPRYIITVRGVGYRFEDRD